MRFLFSPERGGRRPTAAAAAAAVAGAGEDARGEGGGAGRAERAALGRRNGPSRALTQWPAAAWQGHGTQNGCPREVCGNRKDWPPREPRKNTQKQNGGNEDGLLHPTVVALTTHRPR